jgi:hypothetical protein
MIRIKKYSRIHEGQCSIDGQLFAKSNERETGNMLNDLFRSMGIDYMKFFKMDRLSKTGFILAELLLRDEEFDGHDTGLFYANSYSSLDDDSHYQTTITHENYYPSPSVFVYTLANVVLGEICIRHKIYGENLFLIGKDFCSSHLTNYARTAFADDNLHTALVGWLDVYDDRCEAFTLLVGEGGSGPELTNENIAHLISES